MTHLSYLTATELRTRANDKDDSHNKCLARAKDSHWADDREKWLLSAHLREAEALLLRNLADELERYERREIARAGYSITANRDRTD